MSGMAGVDHLPFVDTQVEYITASKVRGLTGRELRTLRKSLVVLAPRGRGPLAVIIPMEVYLRFQRDFVEAANRLQNEIARARPILDTINETQIAEAIEAARAKQ